ncbi:MAG: aspartate--tRNA(Asn) ligase [Clostridia bacterium]|nr:aspartate--tRNA(Asn) ligase [Clostridia bacterium]
MNISKINALKVGEINKVQGFVENIRDKKSMAFLVVKDITGKLQLTIEKEKFPQLGEKVKELTIHSVITVEGPVVENSYVRLGGIEMLPESLVIESVAAPLPIEEKSSIDLRLDHRWIDLRSERNTLIFKVQTLIAAKFREFLVERRFVEIHTPKLIGAASESGADVFELTYFDRKAYLAQSPQFYKQMAMAAGFERIFECGPVFRAEKSNTNKHATEFTGFDLEFSGIESFEDVMKMEEEMIAYVMPFVKEQYGEQIKALFGEEVVVPTLPFPRVKLADLYQDLQTMYGLDPALCEKGDLCTEGERLCRRYAMDKFGHEFLFVTDFSAEKRAFYHMRNEEGVPQGYDLIWKGCEITTGAQREHRLDVLRAQAEEKGLDQDVKFYLEFFRYGCPPHGGFGIGLDRLTMILLNIPIKEVMFLFRGPDRLTP